MTDYRTCGCPGETSVSDEGDAKYKRGVLRLFSDLAESPMKGAHLAYDREN